MTVSPINADNYPQVAVDGNRVIITNLVVESAELAEILNSQPDTSTAAKNILLTGAAVAGFGSTQASVALMNQQLSDAMGTFQKESNRLFNQDDGEFVAATHAATSSIAEMFDPELRGSVTDKIQETQRTFGDALLRNVLQQLSLDNSDGPLTALQRNIVESIHTPVEKKLDEVLAQVAELKTEQAVDAAEAAAFDKSTAKGVAFEHEVESLLAKVTEPLGDSLENTGLDAGVIAKSKKGDLVSTINPENATDRRIAIECKKKNRKLSQADTRKELEGAATNRDAAAAMIVFDCQDNAPTNQPIVMYGRDRMVVALPEDNPAVVLSAAYTCLRAMVTRSTDKPDDTFDPDSVLEALEELNGVLSNMRTIHTAHNSIERGLADARKSVDDLVEKAKAATENVVGALNIS